MSPPLTSRQRHALELLELEYNDLVLLEELPGGIGKSTMQELVNLGLAETGPSDRRHGAAGFRITPDGYRCMYGMTLDEIMAKPDGAARYPLKVWRWPPE